MFLSENQPDLINMLPDQLEGWQAEKALMLNTLSDLYNYIDRGAELYMSYGFGKALNPPAKHVFLADTRHHLGIADYSRIEPVKAGWGDDILI